MAGGLDLNAIGNRRSFDRLLAQIDQVSGKNCSLEQELVTRAPNRCPLSEKPPHCRAGP